MRIFKAVAFVALIGGLAWFGAWCGYHLLATHEMKSASEKAEAGYVDSQLMLADFYQYGTYGPVNPDKAKHWYEIAAGNGNRSAKAALCREYKIMCEEKENAG